MKMSTIFGRFLVVVGLCGCVVDSQPLTNGRRIKWTRLIGPDQKVNESAFISNEYDIVVTKSADPDLRAINLLRSSTVYDFTDLNPGAVIVPRKHSLPCFLKKTRFTFRDMQEELYARKGSLVRTTAKESLNGTGKPLSCRNTLSLYENHPFLFHVCRFRDIVVTTPLLPEVPPPPKSRQITVLTLEAQVTITIPQRFSDAAGQIPASKTKQADEATTKATNTKLKKGTPTKTGPKMSDQSKGTQVKDNSASSEESDDDSSSEDLDKNSSSEDADD